MEEIQSGFNYKRITLAARWSITMWGGVSVCVCVCVCWWWCKGGPVRKHCSPAQDDHALSMAHNRGLSEKLLNLECF